MNRDHFWLTDDQFALLMPLQPAKRRGKPRLDDRRAICEGPVPLANYQLLQQNQLLSRHRQRSGRKGLMASDVAHAHEMDLEAQAKYGVRFLTYWFDQDSGTGFCLIEAPDKETAIPVHVPLDIIDVDLSADEGGFLTAPYYNSFRASDCTGGGPHSRRPPIFIPHSPTATDASTISLQRS